MRYRYHQISFSLALLIIYTLLFYFIFTQHQKLDFFSFYSTPYALMQGDNPYRDLSITEQTINKLVPVNLNPPIVLWIFSPFAKLGYSTSLIIWSITSVVLGLIAVSIVFHYTLAPGFLLKNQLNLYLLYFAFFPTLMNIATLQLGTLLFFLIMLGYHFYLSNRNYLSGISWGIIIAMKLFPALLFFLVIKQGRFKVFWVMLFTTIIAWLIPLLVYGTDIYEHYYSMMSRVYWYGNGWNASICGFIFRLFVHHNFTTNLMPFKILYVFLFFILLLWYLKKLGPIEKSQINHQPFCLTLVMMLLMSPMGWIYYFPLLIFPLILTWFVALNEIGTSTKTMLIWLSCLFLINFPLDYVEGQHMSNTMSRMSFYSTPFYGLLFLTYLLGKKQAIYGDNEIQIDEAKHFIMPTIIIILVFGLFVPAFWFVIRYL